MRVLGLQGSPRKKGNTNFLLKSFMAEAEALGATTRIVEVGIKKIGPCMEYLVCEKKGYCPIDDDMPKEIYGLLWEADVVVLATPIFFYNAPAQLKALIDRCQTFWARKYRLHLDDPGRRSRRGYMLALGATRGKNLFEGMNLTARYFFDAIGATFHGSLTYRRIEEKGDMQKHPTVLQDVRRAAADLLGPLQQRKKVIFAGTGHTGCSQMAAAFLRHQAGDRFEALGGGVRPGTQIDPAVVAAMQAVGIDMAYLRPQSLDAALGGARPDIWINLSAKDDDPRPAAGEVLRWDFPALAGASEEVIAGVRDEIQRRVTLLAGE